MKRPSEAGRVSYTPGALHTDRYAYTAELATGWRREHARCVWQAMQSVMGLACLLESMHPLSGDWDSCTDEACRAMGWLREG